MVWSYEPAPEDSAPLRAVPDLGGMAVDDADGRPTGTVYGSLIEAENGMVRYLDIRLDHHDRHVLVPVGHTRLHELAGQRRVRLRAALREDLHEIPAYEPPSRPRAAYERNVLAAHARIFHGGRYYAHPAFDHSGLYAGEHPILRGDVPPTTPLPLTPLSRLPDYRVAEGEPDIRGWTIAGEKGASLARIVDLLVDMAAEKVRYVVAEIAGGGRVLVPVGYLVVDVDPRRIRAPALTAEDLAALPPYEEPVTRLMEEKVREALDTRLDGNRRFARLDYRAPRLTGRPAR